ncbi:hypothetical protein [Mycobacterium sp.]|uniref:hypothetical protein n=1 Tax=Mycobacterium sp. TaxID=1785 RepID=UPI0025F11BF0|nr:hypothetical protein [Mycobacterium sp.]
MQQYIVPGVITGVFAVLVALTAALFGQAKNRADAAESITAGAKILADMSVDEVVRKDSKIVVLYGRINRLRAHIRELRDRLVSHGDIPPPLPGAYYDDDDPDADLNDRN